MGGEHSSNLQINPGLRDINLYGRNALFNFDLRKFENYSCYTICDMKKFFLAGGLCLSVVLIALPIITGCTKSSDGHGGSDSFESDAINVGANNYVHKIMKSTYYWCDGVRDDIDKSTTTVKNYFYLQLVPEDRWSWMTDAATYYSSETGVSTSYGMSYGQPLKGYEDYGVYVTMVYKDSPFAKAGITRGWRINRINGSPVMDLIIAGTFYSELDKNNNEFTFTDLNGNTKVLSIGKSTFTANCVLKSEVYTSADYPALPAGAKVGYLVYRSFNKSLKNELIEAVGKMKGEGITDMVLDLRLNGGGDVGVCTELASLLAPESADGKVFIKIKHNAKNSGSDFDYKIKRTANSLNLRRLFVIGGRGTASASESVINCLKPYMQVEFVGDTTYGKPNGMYLYTYMKKGSKTEGWAFYPTCFYCVNSNGEGNYDDGIVPVKLVYDDLYHDWGTEETALKACLDYISTGSYPSITYSPKLRTKSQNVVKVRTERDASHYGQAIVRAEHIEEY